MALLFVSTKRAASRRGLLGLIFLAIACITAVLAGTLGYTQLAATNALRASIPETSGGAAFQRLHTTQPDGAEAKQQQSDAFTALFSNTVIPDSTRIFHSSYASPSGNIPSSGTATSLPADTEFSPTAWADAGPHVSVSSGELPGWMDDGGTVDGREADGGETGGENPAGPVQAVITEDTAQSLKLEAGQTLRLATDPRLRVEIAAVVAPDRQAELVLSAAATDYDGEQVHPILVPPPVMSGMEAAKSAWTILPDPGRITAAQLPGLVNALTSLEYRADGEDLGSGGVVVTGSLTETLDTAQSATQAVRAVVPVPLILLVLLSAVALHQLARLLARTRSVETTLLTARGASAGQHARMGLAEGAPVALGGTVCGYAAAVVVTPLVASVWTGAAGWSTAFAEMVAATWPVLVVTAIAALAVLTGTVLADGLRGSESLRRGETGRRSTPASWVAVALILGAAAVSLWQLLRTGSPLVAGADGALLLNPAAVPAPALVIVAGAVIALAAMVPATTVVQRLAARSRGIGVVLAARQLSRRISSYLLPVALITVTVATGTLAAGYARTTATANDAAAHLTNGSDVRLAFPRPTVISSPDDLVDLQPFTEAPATTAVSPVIVNDIKIGDADAQLAAVDPQTLPDLLRGARHVTDAAALSSALSGDVDGGPEVPLPPATRQLRLQLSSTGQDVLQGAGLPSALQRPDESQRRVELTAWFETGRGQLAPVELGAISLHDSTEPQSHSIAVSMPDSFEADSLRAIDFNAMPTSSTLKYTVTVSAISAVDGAGTERAVEMPNGLQFQLRSGAFGTNPREVRNARDGKGIVLTPFASARTVQGRLMPTPPGGPVEAAVPVVATDGLLQALDLQVGDELSLQPAGTVVPARIAAAVPALPGVGGDMGVMVDITAYQGSALETASTVPEVGQLWFASSNPEQTVAGVEKFAGPQAEITTADNSYAELFLAPAITTLWIGAAGALLIGAIALAASVRTLAHLRRSETGILAALGFPPRLLASGRRAELLTVGLLAVAAGCGTGWLASSLTADVLAGATVMNAPAGMPVPVAIAWPPLTLVLAAQLAVLAAACWFYGWLVHRQAHAAREVKQW